MGRLIFHIGGLAFLAWTVLVAAKWAFLTGLAVFGYHAWGTRPGGEERSRRVEQARQERPVAPDERVRDAVRDASRVTLRLVERRWLRATVEARNPTEAVVELGSLRCRVLYSPDGKQRPDILNRGPWRVRIEPGASYRGEVSFYESDVSGTVAPVALADYRCSVDVQVLPTPTAPLGTPSHPIKMTPGGYRSAGSQ